MFREGLCTTAENSTGSIGYDEQVHRAIRDQGLTYITDSTGNRMFFRITDT